MQVSFPLTTYPEVELLAHMPDQFSVVLELSIFISTVAIATYTPTISAVEYFSPHIYHGLCSPGNQLTTPISTLYPL